MLLAIIVDVCVACLVALLIIYALAFSVHCIFLSESGERFSFEKTLEKIEAFCRGESMSLCSGRKEEKCQKNQ